MRRFIWAVGLLLVLFGLGTRYDTLTAATATSAACRTADLLDGPRGCSNAPPLAGAVAPTFDLLGRDVFPQAATAPAPDWNAAATVDARFKLLARSAATVSAALPTGRFLPMAPAPRSLQSLQSLVIRLPNTGSGWSNHPAPPAIPPVLLLFVALVVGLGLAGTLCGRRSWRPVAADAAGTANYFAATPALPFAPVSRARLQGEPAMDPCRILLVDADPLFCCGLHLLLARLDDAAIVAQTSCAYRALSLAQRLRPDLILVGEALPGLSGRALAVALSALASRPRVVLLASRPDPLWLQRHPGVRAELARDLPPAQLLRALTAVRRDEAIPGQVVLRLLPSSRPTGAAVSRDPGAALPPRLLQMLDCLLLGYSVGTTGCALGLAEQTIKNRTSELLHRLGAEGRSGVVRLGVIHGWAVLGSKTAAQLPATPRPARMALGGVASASAISSRCLVRKAGGKAAWSVIPTRSRPPTAHVG